MSDAAAVADVGIIGGTGLYSLLADAEQHRVETPWGEPSAELTIGEFGGRRVAFLPRHGEGHRHAPHAINYRANLWALHALGVRQVLAPCAVGGLRDTVAPGDLVAPDQLVDRTFRRIGSFVEAGAVHLPFADPYCPRLLDTVGRIEGVARGGTMVVVEGPRFSTRAESRHYADQGWDLVNMTGAPEAALARELRLCYAAVAVVTDMDAGTDSGEGVGQAEVFALFARTLDRLRGVLEQAVSAAPDPEGCSCYGWADDLELPYLDR